MRKNIVYYIFTTVLILWFAATGFCGMTSTNYRITTSVLSVGGIPIASASYLGDSCMGQPSPLMDPSDPPYSTNYEISPGFWHTSADNDGDGLINTLEDTIGLNPGDADYDDDGILDGAEDADHDGVVDTTETDPGDADSDADFIQDGTELGYTVGHPEDTNTGIFIPDADGGVTTTNPLNDDTDSDNIKDGVEDANQNGMVDEGETDPNDPGDPPAPIPTLDKWGMIVFALVLITMGTVMIRRRQEQ